MKSFYYILTVYMMAIFLMPCNDAYAYESFQNSSPVENVANHESHDHSKSHDMCSPFCVCSCCGIAKLVNFKWTAFNFSAIKSLELTVLRPQYVFQFVSPYLGEIWQPPKINA